MNDSNSLSNGESQNLDILSLARGIYELLSINKEIESEDELFSDEVYIEIITKIIPDIQDEISPGSTPEEKVEIIKMLLSLLGNLVEANLSKINPKKLVLEHDKDSAKNFLELLLELIQAIINNGGEELEDDDDNSMGMRGNISDGNIKKKKTKADSFDKEEEVNMDDLESLKLSRDKKNDKKNKNENENEESEEMKIDGNFILDKEKTQSEKNIIFDLENNEDNKEVNKSNSKVMNVSHITDDIKDEKKEDLENNKNNISNKDKDNNIDNNDIENDIINDNDNDNDDKLNSNKKYDIPALLEGEGEAEEHDDKDKNKKSTEDFNYIDNDDDDLSKKEIKFEENKYNFQGSEDDLSSNNVKDSAYSVPQPYNKFVLTNNNSSEEYGDSILKKDKQKEKGKNKKKKEEEDDIDLNYNDELDEKDLNLNIDKNSNTSLLNSNISLHSKKSKKSNRIDDSKFQDSSNKKGSSKKKESVVGGAKKSIKSSSKKGSHVNTNKSNNDFENENDLSESQSNDISKSSVYTIPQGQKSVASSKKNSKISKKNENNNNLNKSNKSNISKKSKSKSSCSTIINSEIPLDDKELKYELIKELKKMYGNKLDKALFENNNILDIIIQDLKLTKKQENLRKKENQQKTESKDQDKDKEKSEDKNIDIYNTDDVFLNKEFLKKNQKQLQQKLQMYNQKLKQRQIEQEKYIRDIGQNVQFMKKIRELEQKKLENDILRKKEMLKNNNNAEEIFFCQKVYDNYFLLEKDKKDKEIESITMLNNMKLNEKLKSINDIERYYRDKIAILNEIGRRERIEKRRSKMEDEFIYLQLNSIPQRQLKNKMKQILNSLDDEYYNNVQVDNNNQEEIEKILDNYYKK